MTYYPNAFSKDNVAIFTCIWPLIPFLIELAPFKEVPLFLHMKKIQISKPWPAPFFFPHVWVYFMDQ